MKHYSLASKVYSLFGQILLVHNFCELAEKMFEKLRLCSHTDKDAVVKMFAYKQLGHTYIKLERYESAVMSFKFMLGMAWTI